MNLTLVINSLRLINKPIKEFFSLIITVTKIILKGHLKILDNIKNSEDSVLIVGNGPSLSQFNLKDVKRHNIELCCVNSFACENPLFFELKPKYYCAIDPDIYSKNALYPEDNNKLFECLKKVDWSMTLICKVGQQLPFQNDHIRYVYLPSVTYEDSMCATFLYKHSLASFRLINVIGACLFFCITAKMKKVYLIGVENDWHKELIVGDDNTVYRKKEHFYGEYLENVTEKGYINKGELYKYFQYYVFTLKAYSSAAKYASELNVPVYNLTLNSYIDTFEKKKEIG